jgi:hypothetical protein
VLGAGSSITGTPFCEAGGASQALDVQNNLLINTGTGYAYYAAVPAGIAISDDNDLLTNGNNVSRWGGFDQSSLLVLQGISGKDQHSISWPVAFAASSDLHLVGASRGDSHLRGASLPAVTSDIDGEARSVPAPYMGADEVWDWPLAVEPTFAAATLMLLAPAPNPSRSGSLLAFTVPRAGRVRLAIFDASGRCVRTLVEAPLDAGPHLARWDGRDDGAQRLAPGTYFCVLDALHARASRKAVVLR